MVCGHFGFVHTVERMGSNGSIDEIQNTCIRHCSPGFLHTCILSVAEHDNIDNMDVAARDLLGRNRFAIVVVAKVWLTIRSKMNQTRLGIDVALRLKS